MVAEKQVLIVGNISDGFTFVGPFDDPDEAADYGETQYRNEAWWVATLFAPIGGEPTPEELAKALAGVKAPAYEPDF